MFGKWRENKRMVKTGEEWERFGLTMNIESQILLMLLRPASVST